MSERLHPSGAVDVLRQSPKKFRYKQTHRTASSSSQNDGSLYHSFTVGGKEAEEMPFKDLRTKAAKDWWADCEARGVIPMRSGGDIAHIRAAAVASRKRIFNRFGVFPEDDECVPERTIRWTSPEGAECEGTPDLLVITGDTVYILELKSWDDIPTFRRSVGMKGWDVQRAAYIQAVQEQYPDKHVVHVFLAQELKAPYCNAWVAPTDEAHEVGHAKWVLACQAYANNTEEDWWDADYDDQTYDASSWEKDEYL